MDIREKASCVALNGDAIARAVDRGLFFIHGGTLKNGVCMYLFLTINIAQILTQYIYCIPLNLPIAT